METIPFISYSTDSNYSFEEFYNYDWPGNVRELNNIVERMCILYPGKKITSMEVPSKLLANANKSTNKFNSIQRFEHPILARAELLSEDFSLKQHIEDIEVSLIKEALTKTNKVVAQAAKLLGLRRTTLIEKMRKYKLHLSKAIPQDN